MKSKLKVKRIVDSFLSKDDVGFYKIEWEESWLPVDAFQHLKYMIEEFWKHKKASEGSSIQRNITKQNLNNENISAENLTTEKLSEECSSEQLSSEGVANKENQAENKCNENISSALIEETNSVTNIGEKDEKIKCEEEKEKSTCYFCGGVVSLDDLNSHEHEHIRQNCSDVLINLIGECQNDNVVLVHIDGELSSPSKVVSTLDVPPPTVSTVVPSNNTNNLEAPPTMTIHHRSTNNAGLSCPVCNQTFNLFNDFLVHFQSHRSNPRYFFCEECGKQFLSKELFEKHTQLHIDANRRQKSYGSKISSVKSSRKAIRRIIYPRLYQSSGNTESYYASKDQLIDLSESPFGSISGEYAVRADENYHETNKMFVEMLETNRYRKRARKEAAEFSPDVLRSARQYIKAVSKRRKVIKRSRLQAQEEAKDTNPVVHTLVDGIGVDVELERSEDSLPILSYIEGKKAYSCKICSKTFFNKFHHREHYNVHSGEMPYECEFCLKRFAQRSGWNRHIKLHHKYDVFAGPLPRFATDKQHEKSMASLPSDLSPNLGSPRTNAPKIMEYDVQTYNPKDVQPKDAVTTASEIPPTSSTTDAASPSPISELTRLTYETHSPTHPPSLPPSHPPSQPPTYQYRYDQLPDAVKRAMQTSITPPSFSEASITQHATMSQQMIMTESSDYSTEIVQAPKKSHVSGEKTTAFQCKKVRTMNGDLIFMIRVSAKTASVAPNKEFAYILDDAGFVESRIFVDDYPGGDWLDFPLDETANDVLRSRVHDYDEQNRRGPKPAHLAANRKQLSKTDSEKDNIVTETGKSFVKIPRAKSSPVSTKDIIASSLVYTTTVAGESTTTIQKSTHGRSFRSGREKRFSCNICERKFLAQAHLNDHMLIHTGELPYKCMFCNRPFRHKSGLNSHHKRHIQRGVFNRPISSKDKVLYPADKPNIADVVMSHQASAIKEYSSSLMVREVSPLHYPKDLSPLQLNDMSHGLCPPQFTYAEIKDTQSSKTPNLPTKEPSEKPKRKGRKPKQVRKSAVTAYFNGEEYVTKQEDILEGIFPDTGKKESNNDVFKCNFCSLTFPMRTAYLKHVHRMHKASNTNDINIGELDSDDNTFSEFHGTFIKQEVFESPIEMEDGLNNGLVENLFPDVTIKEEVIDDAYLE